MKIVSYWRWLFFGSGAGPGIRRFFDWWIVLHAAVGGAFSITLPVSLQIASTKLLLPISSVFIGLSFAWGGHAQALLQSVEIKQLAFYRNGGYEEYLYTFQSAVLLILVSLCLWGLAGLGLFDKIWPIENSSIFYKIIIGILFFFASLAIRECWQVVLGAQAMLLSRFKIQMHNNDKNRPTK